MFSVILRSSTKTGARSYSSVDKKLRLVLIGPPGGGKGTQAAKLKKFYNLPHISTGDLLRNEIKSGSELGKRVAPILQAGGLVDNATMANVVRDSVLGTYPEWVLDGYPRTVDQAIEFDKFLESVSKQINGVLYLDVDDSILLERITNRWTHIPSGRVYHTSYAPPKVPGKDDVTGEALVQRPDDTLASMIPRLEKYHSMTKPLVEYYKSKGILHTIPSPSSDVGWPHIERVLNSLKQ
eukprot:TRINITY_DN8105_c0_g1_i1.p1 TRINITY_DN8105_c0_g1~~TRINITY_DN8105_c0_g1_i1.p1  ORF type:complete len:238 (-),score=54.05 TRINITY_DN8105_c0_g1_i1:24-737(-)